MSKKTWRMIRRCATHQDVDTPEYSCREVTPIYNAEEAAWIAEAEMLQHRLPEAETPSASGICDSAQAGGA